MFNSLLGPGTCRAPLSRCRALGPLRKEAKKSGAIRKPVAEDYYGEVLRALASQRRRRALRELSGRRMGLSELAQALESHNLPNVQRDVIEPLLALGLIKAMEDPKNPRRRLYTATELGQAFVAYLEEGGKLVAGLGRAPIVSRRRGWPRWARAGISLMLWALFAGSVLGVARGVTPSWVPAVWFALAGLGSWRLMRRERGRGQAGG